jgi:hypothetical protein
MSDLLLAIAAIMNEPTSRVERQNKMIRAVREWGTGPREPGRARQAAAWLQDRPNRTVKEAARLFGVTHGAVAVARAGGPFPAYTGPHDTIPDAPPRQSGRAVQAAAWLQARPFRTLAFAARLFGVTVSAVSAARALGPYAPYEGPHDRVLDAVPANMPAIIEAAEWAAVHPGMPLSEVAKGYGIKLGDLRRWINREIEPR